MWTRHTLSVENGEDGSTSVVGCDPKTGLSFVRWTRESLSDEKSNKKPTSTADCDVETGESVMNFVDGFCACWDADGDETSCRGVNLWPTD